jgi:glycosyltransferase involved in cell wall biosynthesis
MLTVIIPANNEEGHIGPCLDAVLASDWPPSVAVGVRIIVAVNASTDATVAEARARADAAAARGWSLQVLDIAQPGKLNALNVAEAELDAGNRVYLDADVLVDPDLLVQIQSALDVAPARYATGTVDIQMPRSWASRAYRRIYRKVPYNTSTVAGYGLFAVNPAGRARWGTFPDIIADDQFVRLQFDPDERVRVPARYRWWLVEGFWTLVRVRGRQDRGNAEIAALWPEKLAREDKAPTDAGWMARAALGDPVGFFIYATVIALARYRRSGGWTRGR